MKKVVLEGLIDVNSYIIDKNGKCLIVDPGSNYEKLKAEIGGLEVVGILLTHGHFDHIDLIGHFKVPIYIHKNDDFLLKKRELSLYPKFIEPSYYYDDLDVRTVIDESEIPFEDEMIKVIHTPGHTSGSVCYLYRQKLFSGDTLFYHSSGRTDFPTGSEQDMKNSFFKLLDNLDENIKVYPGHEENTTIKEEKQNNPYYLYYKKHQ